MKKIRFFFVILLFIFQGHVSAKDPIEKELKEQAKELSYMGQLDKANELLGKETTFSSGKADDGWDMTSLMMSMVWGAIGAGYFIYGKKQSRAVFLLCGIGLCVFPMFISGFYISLVLGLGMILAPFKIDF